MYDKNQTLNVIIVLNSYARFYPGIFKCYSTRSLPKYVLHTWANEIHFSIYL